MAADGANSVTHWVNDLKAGDRGEAARLLWQRYFERLARLAQARLRHRAGALGWGGYRAERLRQFLSGGHRRPVPAAGRPR